MLREEEALETRATKEKGTKSKISERGLFEMKHSETGTVLAERLSTFVVERVDRTSEVEQSVLQPPGHGSHHSC